MTPIRLFAIVFITACTAVGWFILGGAIQLRTGQSRAAAGDGVAGAWGPRLEQLQPRGWYLAPGVPDGKAALRPDRSDIVVALDYEPRQKGLLWYRAYSADFRAEYDFVNPTPIPQTLYIQFRLPSPAARYSEFRLEVDGRPTTANVNGREPVTEAVEVGPGGRATLKVSYKTRGLDSWTYGFGEETRVQNFSLAMRTDFAEVDFPTSSPSERTREGNGWNLSWLYPDEIGARPVGINMPNVLNPGPIAARITFFAPVSLVFFFAVLVVICLVRRIDLHPMNFFFLAAGCFAFQLLFAYLVDLVPLTFAFVFAAGVSLVLVSGYLLMARGAAFARLAALAQLAYMVLFSYSFFFDGLTGITITAGAILTLAILMATTARIDWSARFARKPSAGLSRPAEGF